MKSFILSTAMFCGLGASAFAQTITPKVETPNTGVQRTGDLKRTEPGGRSDDDSKSTTSIPASDRYVRPDAKTRSKRYINSVIGPFALARQVAGAGISTWRNSPEEWGDHWEGFGRRVASNFGKNVIKQTTTYGLDEAFKIDSHFYRSKDKSVGARVRNALISPVTARDREGKRVIGVPHLVGTYTANIVAREVWYPARYDWKDGVKSGTVSLGFNAAFNLFKEFVWHK
jgi:hypothetical protein